MKKKMLLYDWEPKTTVTAAIESQSKTPAGETSGILGDDFLPPDTPVPAHFTSDPTHPSTQDPSVASSPFPRPRQCRKRLFESENTPTFFRRLTWSADGGLLIAPTGRQGERHCAWAFGRNDVIRGRCVPLFCAPMSKHVVCVKSNPRLWRKANSDPPTSSSSSSSASSSSFTSSSLSTSSPPLFNLPYRLIFAVASLDSIAIYDSEHSHPIAFLSKMHYDSITDLAWSTDGETLAVTSIDGCVSFVTFEEGELGCPLTEKETLSIFSKVSVSDPTPSTPLKRKRSTSQSTSMAAASILTAFPPKDAEAHAGE